VLALPVTPGKPALRNEAWREKLECRNWKLNFAAPRQKGKAAPGFWWFRGS
jgi:hypothetical protein